VGKVKTLDELALLHGADKSSAGHNYAYIYDRYLSSLRSKPIVMLEIGVQDGPSLRMWRDYFPEGHIWGLDIDPACKSNEEQRIAVVIGDQKDPAALARCAPGEDFDLVLDDGGHYAVDQRASLLELWPRIKRGGFYIVEDTHTSYRGGGFGNAINLLRGFVREIHQPHYLPGLASIAFYGPAGTCVMVKA
jgi:hypothetical protein